MYDCMSSALFDWDEDGVTLTFGKYYGYNIADIPKGYLWFMIGYFESATDEEHIYELVEIMKEVVGYE